MAINYGAKSTKLIFIVDRLLEGIRIQMGIQVLKSIDMDAVRSLD